MAENKQIHHLQCVFPKKKFVLQPESRTTCELKELLHNANTNELLSPPRAEPRGTGRGGERLHLSEGNQGWLPSGLLIKGGGKAVVRINNLPCSNFRLLFP